MSSSIRNYDSHFSDSTSPSNIINKKCTLSVKDLDTFEGEVTLHQVCYFCWYPTSMLGTVDVHSFITIKMIKHIPRRSSNENIFWLVLVITNASIAGVHKIQRSYGQIGYNRREFLQRLDYFQTKEWVRASRLIYELNPRDS